MAIRVNIKAIQKAIQSRENKLDASNFRPELERHAKRVLRTCIDKTPARSGSKIAAAQARQYDYRVNYIPSVHDDSAPALIVKEDGSHWLHVGDKWYAASYRRLPDAVQAVYQNLLDERERRMQTTENEFIANRVQARFLYRRSWWEVAKSAGLQISVDSKIINARTRRKPAKNPPKGYAQWRGGKDTLSLAVFNPFLEEESRYKPFSGLDILRKSIEADRPRLNSEVAKKLQAILA